MVGMDALRDELPGTDILANTLPLTDETRGMIGRAEIDLMNDRSVIINIGRGATIDEAAMIDALKSGKLRAAGLDVFETEPLPEDSPLWEMDEVIVSPHAAAYTRDYFRDVGEIVRENVARLETGAEFTNRVV